MDERGTNFALLTIVAIVAIVALVVLLKAQSQKAMSRMEDKNVAGQMMVRGWDDCKSDGSACSSASECCSGECDKCQGGGKCCW